MNTRFNSKLSLSLAAISFLLFTSSAYAYPWGQKEGKINKAREQGFDQTMQELNLTPQQRQQIMDQRVKDEQQAQALRQQLKASNEELNRELEKDVPDQAKISQLVSQTRELMGKRIESKVESILLLKKILTPEQYKMLRDKRAQSKDQKGGRP